MSNNNAVSREIVYINRSALNEVIQKNNVAESSPKSTMAELLCCNWEGNTEDNKIAFAKTGVEPVNYASRNVNSFPEPYGDGGVPNFPAFSAPIPVNSTLGYVSH